MPDQPQRPRGRLRRAQAARALRYARVFRMWRGQVRGGCSSGTAHCHESAASLVIVSRTLGPVALGQVGRSGRYTRREEGGLGMLSADMRRVVEEQRLGFAATVCPDGTPNLSPKGTTAVWHDDCLVFADIRSPRTTENLR